MYGEPIPNSRLHARLSIATLYFDISNICNAVRANEEEIAHSEHDSTGMEDSQTFDLPKAHCSQTPSQLKELKLDLECKEGVERRNDDESTSSFIVEDYSFQDWEEIVNRFKLLRFMLSSKKSRVNILPPRSNLHKVIKEYLLHDNDEIEIDGASIKENDQHFDIMDDINLDNILGSNYDDQLQAVLFFQAVSIFRDIDDREEENAIRYM